MNKYPQAHLVELSSALAELTSESTNPASEDLDSLSPLEIAHLMNAQDKLVALAVEKQLENVAQAIEAAADALRAGGRIVYVGAGTSGRLGVLDASECPPTFSVEHGRVIAIIAGGEKAVFTACEGAEDDAGQGRADIARVQVTPNDLVVGLAASGRTPYVIGALKEAGACGAVTAGISCNGPAPLHAVADISITPDVGPEILAGSTRLKSATAQKMILNMISTGAMVRIGKVFGNRMVDLNASNEKLRARAVNLVADLTPTTKHRALAALVEADWDIKVAILTERTGENVRVARDLIKKHGGHLRAALEEVGDKTP